MVDRIADIWGPGRHGRYLLVVAGIAALLAVSGCAPDGTAPADAAQEFHQAMSSSDWSSACSMLESDTREKTAREQEGSCEDHLRNLQIQEPGTVARTETYGRGAFVEFENDAVFLAAAEGGWKITAAGCTPNGDAPYTCEVGGN
ncbi:hypothetical protein ARTSIC4J27_1064 [Pseudarthrobacter siccitolerans]|uniref:Lipoprotein n=1 Tax=Pseudarthrobacter siccitolerans TaxID=861266 RepID=A0A024H074_9MICC|nr:hypothetical protein [Pseudarthrobacter siccitolerans]CCQ45131.1 hypothetical protein ARTSIC4J27_1064 [Pseudarthrobacter siccitolerans]